MKPIFKVVGGLDVALGADRLSRAEARRRARPLNRQWLGAIDQHITEGKAPKLLHVDYRMAKELTNYPSANEGRCYAGQKRLGAKIGVAERTARGSLARLRAAAFLSTKRGGPGRTASWIFCINGRPIFGASDRQSAVQDRQEAAGLDRQEAAGKPLELDPIERKPSASPSAECVTVPERDERWHAVLTTLMRRFDRATVVAWFDKVQVAEVTANSVVLLVPSRFVGAEIVKRFFDPLLEAWRPFAPAVADVICVLSHNGGSSREDSQRASEGEMPRTSDAGGVTC